MKNRTKDILLELVLNGTLSKVAAAFRKHKVVLDDSYFDYELLKTALRRQHDTIVTFLLDKIGCRLDNPNKVDSDETPLFLALKFASETTITTMLKKGASVYDKNRNGETILYAAFNERKLHIVDTILNYQVFVKANCVPESDDDVLHFQIALVTYHKPAVEHYLKCGIDPNKPIIFDFEEYCGLYPVQYTASIGFYYHMFETLVSHGGDLSVKDSNGLSPLHRIFYTSFPKYCIPRIKQTFQNGNDTKFVNIVDINEVSHFQLCCTLNKPKFIKVFIENGANVNSAISLCCAIFPGYTPLHFAVENGCERVVELLLKNGADCNKQNKKGQTPLHLACKISGYWKERIIKLLLDYNASPTIKDENGYTPIHMEFYYVSHEDASIFDMLWSKVQSKVNFTNNEGVSFFHIACATNNINQVKAFLTSGVEVNSAVPSGNYKDYTALHFAALHNKKDMVEFLLKKKAEVNVKTRDQQITPLHLACEFNYMKFHEEHSKCQSEENFKSFPVNLNSTSNRKNQLSIIRLLLTYGADVNAKDIKGITPLLYTALIDQNYSLLNWTFSSYLSKSEKEAFIKEISFRLVKTIQILISHKANVIASSHLQESILHIIARYETLRITENSIKRILAEGLDINTVDNDGLTPLHIAVKFSNKQFTQILLKFKADINAECKNLNTPLHIVIEQGMRKLCEREILVTLLENGGNVNIKYKESMLQRMFDYYTIDRLLNYGADINSEGSLVNTSVIALYENKYLGFGITPSTFISLTIFIYTHVQKLLALKLYVSEIVQQCCNQTYKYYIQNESQSMSLDHIFGDCIKELEKMKLIKIDRYNSLYSILLKNSHELSNHVTNESLIQIVKYKKENKDFPLYSYLLKLQFKRGLIKSDLLQSAKVPLTNVINLELPDLCFDLIMKHLTNRDIVNLIAAAPLENSLKRKINDEDTNQSVPFAKIQKEKFQEKIDKILKTVSTSLKKVI